MKVLLTVMVVCLAAGFVTDAAARCKKAGTSLDFDALQKANTASKVAKETLAAAVSKRLAGELTIDKALAWKKKTVIVYTRCEEKVCYGGVAVIKTDRAKPKALKRGHLPMDEEPFMPVGDALSIDAAGITDVDGDGTDELLVLYTITGEPQPAVGAESWTFLTIWNLGDLTLRWDHMVGQSGDAGVLRGCDWVVTWRDVDCDKRVDLVLNQTCSDHRSCLDPEDEDYDETECKQKSLRPKTTKRVWLTEATSRGYRPKRGKSRYSKDDAAKPFVVIVGSVPSYSGHAATIAQTKADKVAKKGGVKVKIRDSRAFPKFACCYQTLIAGQFTTKAEADALVATLKSKAVKAYVRKAF